MLRRLLGRAQLAEREAELVVDPAHLRLAARVLVGQLQRAPRRGRRFRRPAEGEQAPPQVEEVERALLAAHRGLEGGQRFRGALGVEEGEAELIVGRRVVGRQLQLLAEFLDGLLEPAGAGPRIRQRHHAEVVVRPPHARVLVQGGAQRGARAIVLAGVAPGAADEHAGLRDRPGREHPREQPLGVVRLLHPQEVGRHQELQLRVVGRQRARLGQADQRRLEPLVRGQRAGEQPPRLGVPRVLRRQPLEDLRRPRGLAHLEEAVGQRALPLPMLDREQRGLVDGLLRLGEPPLEPLQRRHEQPAFEEGLAVLRLGGLQLAFLQAALRRPPSPGRAAPRDRIRSRRRVPRREGGRWRAGGHSMISFRLAPLAPDRAALAARLAARGPVSRSRRRRRLHSRPWARPSGRPAGRLGVFHRFRFADRLPESGITFVHRAVDDVRKSYRPVHYDHGNGIAAADVDGDGRPDLYFVNQAGGSELWKNLGGGSVPERHARGGRRPGRTASA